MIRFFLFCTFLVLNNRLSGQYTTFPKLENLYQNNNYDKCLEKSEAEIKEHPSEIWPHIWQMRCYLAINELSDHPLKKNALSKALNIAIRIKKKDKAEKLNEVLKKDFETISYKTIIQVSNLPEEQYSNGLSIYEKLKLIDKSLNLDYQQYLYMTEHEDPDGFLILKHVVEEHYGQFRRAVRPLENLEPAYADLMNEYFTHGHADFAKDVYFKATEVYNISSVCRETYLNHIKDLASYIGYYSDENTLNENLMEFKTADSIFNDQMIKESIIKIKKFKAIIAISRKPIKNKTTVNLISNYLKVYEPKAGDSANTFFDGLLMVNANENLKIETDKIYDFWIISGQEIKRLKQPIESIKSIHIYYVSLKKYELDVDFLNYCKKGYPALKPGISPMQAALEKLIIEQISKPENADNPDIINKYAKKIDNKAIRDQEFKTYYTLLSGLLEKDNFSGFAVTIVKALNDFPADPYLLTLKKQWVINDYKSNYIDDDYGYEQFFSRLPDEEKCDAGVVNKKGNDKVLQKINYFRRLAGSPDSCLLDEALNAKCQQAALMMSANDALSHSPPKTWKCYTLEGASAAGASNLSLGHAFHHAIIGQMEDDGSGNTACGHRRWILNPSNTVFGHGSSMNASSIYAFGTNNPKLKRKIYFNDEQAICWPSTDYFPVRLVPERWSFSLKNVEFDKAKITVTENGKKLEVTIEPLAYGYGPNTLVWLINDKIESGKIYTVTINNIIPYNTWDTPADGKITPKTYTYRVMPIEIN